MTEEDPNVRKRAAIAEIMPKTPFIGWLGLVLETYEPDHVVLRLPFREMRKVKAQTSKPFGVDLLTAIPGQVEKQVQSVIDEGARVFVAGLGVPRDVVDRCHDNNVLVATVCGKVKHTVAAVAAGCDFVTFPVIDGVRYSLPGDFAQIGEDGTITLLGRGSVCINTGGEKVFPEEVEEALKLHHSIRDAVAVAVPDDKFGEVVTAMVELEPGASIDEGEVIAHVKGRLAAFKAPKHVLVVDTIGRAPNAKVDYKRLKAEAVERVGAAT